jgi:alkylhydroperoxidase family enzyme
MSDPISDLREVVEGTPPAPPLMASYLAKVAHCAATITDADVDALTTAGLSEDEIFEQTVAAAIAQGLRRLDTAAAVIG